MNVDRAAAAHTNADVLSRALARSREAPCADRDMSEGSHAQAIQHVAAYVNLLREATETLVCYPLKLELADGRWDVAESSLPAKPRIGDWLALPDGNWRVCGSQRIRPSVPDERKPEREYIVCARA